MAAYSSEDKDWMLTAVFSMRWVRGFENQILELLKNPDPRFISKQLARLAVGN